MITRKDIESIAWDGPDRVAHWRKWIVDGGDASRGWVAKRGDEIVGFCFVAKAPDRHQVKAVYVLPESQSRGIGRDLMAAALAWLGPEKDIALGVAKYNRRAIAFYQRHGFSIMGDAEPSPAGRLPSGKIIPEFEMVRRRIPFRDHSPS